MYTFILNVNDFRIKFYKKKPPEFRRPVFAEILLS